MLKLTLIPILVRLCCAVIATISRELVVAGAIILTKASWGFKGVSDKRGGAKPMGSSLKRELCFTFLLFSFFNTSRDLSSKSVVFATTSSRESSRDSRALFDSIRRNISSVVYVIVNPLYF